MFLVREKDYCNFAAGHERFSEGEKGMIITGLFERGQALVNQLAFHSCL